MQKEPGILMLNPVPKFTEQQTTFEGKLFRAIREASATGNGRDIAIEDFYHEILSYYRMDADKYLIRIAQVDSKGKAYGSLSVAETLYSILRTLLTGMKMKLVTSHDDRFSWYYKPEIFKDNDFLFVPNSTYVVNMVAIQTR